MLSKVANFFRKKQSPIFMPTQEGWLLKSEQAIKLDESQAFTWAASLDDEQMSLAFYLAQLISEGHAQFVNNGVLIPWSQVYSLSQKTEHASLLASLQLPALQSDIVPVLNSSKTLSDLDFQLEISGWRYEQDLLRDSQLIGAVLQYSSEKYLISEQAWHLTQAIDQFIKRSDQERSQHQQELAWGKIRLLASQAKVVYASRYLEGTIILSPETLQLELHQNEQGDVIIAPSFMDAPEAWLERFDAHRSVQDHYDFANQQGRQRVILSEPVKQVLQFIKREMPNRQVRGKKAEAFLRNPYALLGDDLAHVIDSSCFEEEKEQLVTATQIAWHLKPHSTSGLVISVDLVTDNFTDVFPNAVHLECFIVELGLALNEQSVSFKWNEHLLVLDGQADAEYQQGQRILAVWKQQKQHVINYEDIYDLSHYGDRVIGIGEVRVVALPILLKPDEHPQSWSPEMEPAILVGMPDGETLLLPATREFISSLDQVIQTAQQKHENKVTLPLIGLTTNLNEAEKIHSTLSSFLQAPSSQTDTPTEQPKTVKQKTLLISSNFDRLEYIRQRKAWLDVPANFTARNPLYLNPKIQLKPHQQQGLRWLQHLSELGQGCDGALLADDMGLGKTLQILSLLASYYDKYPDAPPSMIVAPVTLLENWEQEIKRFFTQFPNVLCLHGTMLRVLKQPSELIDRQLLDDSITNLLQSNWLGDAKLVITTYDTVRNYEFSLARQEFAFLVCDEAQKIKNPTAIISLAIKKQKAHFKIACTGTPVENHLVDLWNLFDWIQPGLLGTIQNFHKNYRRPIEAKTAEQMQALDELRELIAPQILRRTKQDIAKDLPQKHQFSDSIDMVKYQQDHYQDTITQLGLAKQDRDFKQRARNTWGLLHRIKAICAEPYCLPGTLFKPDLPIEKHLANSPKIKWLVDRLKTIKGKQEKAIIFTELRQVQVAIAFFIKRQFDLVPEIINGDSINRQKAIDRFQAVSGFNVIILSPLAAGAGLNIVAANHVIHFTRTWNPAKEAQATDRAYRIGQKKDVYVYCPTITHSEFETFEVKLDSLMKVKLDLATDMLNGVGADFSPFELFSATSSLSEDSCTLELTDVDRLSGDQFERLYCLLLEADGWEAKQTPKQGGDGGIDIVAIKDQNGLLIQCKRSKKPLGWEAIKEVVAGAAKYQHLYPTISFTKLAVTNHSFNANSKEQARYNKVQLWERTELAIKLKALKLPFSVLANFSDFNYS